MKPTLWMSDLGVAADRAACLLEAAEKTGWKIEVVANPLCPSQFGVRAERTFVDINENCTRGDGRVGHCQVAWLKVDGRITLPGRDL
jgi:hypothetical protein